MEWDYKIQPDSDHVAKFQGNRSRELGERVAKQKKTFTVKHKPVRNGCSGRPKNRENLKFGLKFSVLESITSGIVEVFSLNFSCDLPLLRVEFRLPKFILHSDLRRRAASCRALPRPSSCLYFTPWSQDVDTIEGYIRVLMSALLFAMQEISLNNLP